MLCCVVDVVCCVVDVAYVPCFFQRATSDNANGQKPKVVHLHTQRFQQHQAKYNIHKMKITTKAVEKDFLHLIFVS